MKNDLCGKKFHKLTVLERLGADEHHNAVWRCRCDCGNEITANTRQLKEAQKRDCGCMMGIRKDLTGRRYGMLTAIKPIGKKGRFIVWHCTCDCGNCIDVEARRLQSGEVTNCGCRSRRNMAQTYIGKRFGRLTVVGITGQKSSCGNTMMLCRCDCGNMVEVSTGQLSSGNNRSCGCLRKKPPDDLSNRRYGHLTVIRQAENNSRKWLCQCDCGNMKIVTHAALIKGGIKSCGCITGNKNRIEQKKIKIGERYNHLTVLEFIEVRNKEAIFRCQCDCGNFVEVSSGKLLSGDIKDCGCLSR